MSDKELTYSEALFEKKEGQQDNESVVARAREVLSRIEKNGDAAEIKEVSIRFVVDGRETNLSYYNF